MFADVHGHTAWYEKHGERGPRVLLIMGFGMSGKAWAPQVAGLKDRHQVVIYDNRGVGQSSAGNGAPARMQTWAQDVGGLLDALGWDDVHLVGVSMGGMVAQEFAIRHTARLRSLTLIATTPGGGPHHLMPSLKGLGLFLAANASSGEKRLRALRSLLYPPHAHGRVAQSSGLAESMQTASQLATAAARGQQLLAVLRHNTVRGLPRLHATPTLVIKPAMDLLVPPRNSDRIHRRVPGSMLLSFQDAGHGVTLQCAPEVNDALAAHFQRAEQQRTATPN